MNISPSPPAADPPQQTPFQFRIAHLLYVMAMIGGAIGLMGGVGIVCGLGIVVAWAIVLRVRLHARADDSVLVALILIGIVLTLALCCLPVDPRFDRYGSAHRDQCENNLKQIALGLRNYHDVHGSFPPAFVRGPDGKPWHSWRVLMLPFVERESVYQAYRFDEPWNGPNNSLLAKQIPRIYQCPSCPIGGTPLTGYVAAVGPRTIWPGDETRKISDITDGTANTLLVLESNRLVHWMEPCDVSFDEALATFSESSFATSHAPEGYLVVCGDLFTTSHAAERFLSESATGRNVALADCSIRFFYRLDFESASRLLTIDDGQPVDTQDPELPLARRPRFGNWIRLGVFVVLIFLPLPWVGSRRRNRARP